MRADRGLEHFQVGVLVLRLLETLRQRLEVDLRQVECRRAGFANFVAGDGLVQQAIDRVHHLRNVRRVRVQPGADGLGQRGQAGDAAGELQRRRVGFHGAVERAHQPLMGKEVAAQRVGGNQRVHAILDARQACHAAGVGRLDLAQHHLVRGAEGRRIDHRPS